jgi:capsular exopolysaccharide synthesis family protein
MASPTDVVTGGNLADLPRGWRFRAQTITGSIAAGAAVFPFEGRDSRASEQYRIVRTKIIQQPRIPRMLAVSSPQTGDGKSITALNLAGALALKESSEVLLVDADLRRSSIATLLGVPPAPGLEEVLHGTCPLDEAVRRVSLNPGIYLLQAKQSVSNPVELFDSQRWHDVCAALRREFDFIVIDTTPVGIVADYELVQAEVDGVILVIRPDYTETERCLDALQTVTRSKFLGVICNCVPDWFGNKRGAKDYYRPSHD